MLKMKKHTKFAIGTLLCAAMLANIPLSAVSYTGLGEVTGIKRDTVGDGLKYSELLSTDESGKEQHSYIFEYTPGKGTLPIVRYGNSIYGKDRLATLVASAKEHGDTVLGAVNGDFYSMQTGVPLGVMIDGGKLISTDDSKYAIGFAEDGTAFIGKPSISVSMTNLTRSGETVKIDHINKYPTVWGIYMLTDDFASTTLSTVESLEIIVSLDSELTASGTFTGTVKQVVNDDLNTGIPQGCAVLTVAEESTSYSLLRGISEGDKLQFTVNCAPGWDKAVTAIGGGDLILENSVLPEGTIDEDHEKTSNPRTAVGIKADGTVVFFSVDGRANTSRGLKEAELSAVMAELGCVTALNLDGGGSTSVMVKPSSETDCVYVNIPSDNTYRSIANGLLFISKNKSDGIATALSVSPNTPYLLRASTVSFSAKALDSAYMPTDINVPDSTLTASFAEQYAEDIGSVSGNSFTAGYAPGEYRLNLNAGSMSGDVSVVVTDTLDALEVSPGYTKIKPGTLVELDIDATYNGKQVVSDAKSFYYTINGTHIVPNQKDYPGAMIISDLGYLDTNGNFQSFGGDREGSVEIGVWFDQFVRYVNINIGTGPDIISDFESDGDLGKFKVSTAGTDLYIASADYGHKSSSSLEFGFSYKNMPQSKLAEVHLREPVPMSKDAESVKLWVRGDISGILTATVKDESGNSYDISYNVTKDYSKQLGWREITAVIPQSLKTGTLYLTTLLSVSDMGAGTRVIAIDDAIVYYGEDAAPVLTGLDGHWSAQNIHSLYDMGVIRDADCEIVDGKYYYAPDRALTRGEFAKLLTLWNGIDTSQYAVGGTALEASTPADKVPYIRAAIAHGLMSGRGTLEDGTVLFDADATITREEAFKVIGSLLNSASGSIDFADASEISNWAASGIAKCVGAGIVSGYGDNTIRPGATITRAELASMLAKMK